MKYRKQYIPKKLREKISLRDKGICQNCGKQGIFRFYPHSFQVFEPEPFWGKWISFDIGHIIPEFQGGTLDESNLVLMCNRCNKGLKDKIWRGFKTYALV
jgi:5-methylcytosine-specific restriction endonuclease McrA